MRKPGTNENDVRMSDVICDFCHREWTDDVAMIEGHRGSCVCGRCLAVAYVDVVVNDRDTVPREFRCPLCLEGDADREALGRAGEAGWRSLLHPEVVICRRCIELGARTLDRDRDTAWSIPRPSDQATERPSD
jgi:hypothetical protein